jgi:DNA modification methylase
MTTALQMSRIQPIHPFPARMAPSIVWESLPDNGKRLRVLDPMAGSGTTLVSARVKGHQAIGFDTDPLALLIARAWCYDINPDRLKHRSNLVLERAKRLSECLTAEQAYPVHADKETRSFLSFWFDDRNRIQLTSLSRCVSRVHNPREKTLLWCAFSRLIITKKLGASLAMDISHSRPHRKYEEAPIRPFEKFQHAVDYIIEKSPFAYNPTKAPEVILRHGDARFLPCESSCVDRVITSPPYLNAIDYIRGHKFSLVWMGHSIKSLRSIRSGNIGSERSGKSSAKDNTIEVLKRMVGNKKLNRRHYGMIVRYIGDMKRVLSECKRVLKKDGQAVFVIGDSTIHGVFVKNSEGLIHIAQINGLRLLSRTTRPLPESRRYLPPPNACTSGIKMQSRMRKEVILRFAVEPEC